MEWFQLKEKDGTVCLEFQWPDSDWQTDVLSASPLPQDSLAGRRVLLTGKAPVWMYAHAACVSMAAGCRELAVSQPQLAHPVIIYPVTAGIASSEPAWCRIARDGKAGTLLEFLPPPSSSSGWSDELLNEMAGLDIGTGPGLCITGRGANWMYAGVAAWAMRTFPVIACHVPVQVADAAIRVGGDLPGSLLRLHPATRLLEKPGLVVGVVGDPNSGKSVFSRLLGQWLQERHRNAWCLDCDAASPTPEWYFRTEQSDDRATGRTLRQGQKRSWTPALEDAVVLRLKNLRQVLDITIADLPGGCHTVSPPQRIPPHREVMMREVDRFIVIGRRTDSGTTADLWREELARHGLAGRIVAELQSGDWKAPFAFRDTDFAGPVFRAAVDGLDRTSLKPDGAMRRESASLAALVEHVTAS